MDICGAFYRGSALMVLVLISTVFFVFGFFNWQQEEKMDRLVQENAAVAVNSEGE
jgi:regulatory protein YycI of two-component signal transduction system YycFG